MTFANYLDVLSRRWLTIVICLILALGAAIAYSELASKTYRAQTITFVSLRQSATEGNILQGSQFTLQRVKSYPTVVTSPEVLQPVIDKLNLDIGVGALQDRVSALNPSDTVLMYISVTDSDPERAAAIANAVTEQFAVVVDNLERADANSDSPVKITVTEGATPPTGPISPRLSLNLVLGAIAGLGIGVAVALLRQMLDTTVRTTRSLAELSGTPSLGSITAHSTKQFPVGEDGSESYRTLRNNLAFLEHAHRLIAVTSPSMLDGRSTTVANLAVSMATAGLRVVLLDTDLRNPSIARLMNLPTSVGLTDLLTGQAGLEEVTHTREGVDVIGPGGRVANPSELLSSQALTDMLDVLSDHYDVILLDSPPILDSSDAVILARQAQGAVILARRGETTRREVEDATEALGAGGARLIGCVLTCTVPYKYRTRKRSRFGRRWRRARTRR